MYSKKQKKSNSGPDRRQFLRGSGGAFLCIPFLPSIFGDKLYAQQAMGAIQRAVFFFQDHCGFQEIVHPALGASWQMIDAHSRRLQINSLLDAGVAFNTSDLTPFKDDLTVINGMAAARWGNAHNHKYALNATEENRKSGGLYQSQHESMDMVLARSNSVYPVAPKLRHLPVIGGWGSSISMSREFNNLFEVNSLGKPSDVYQNLFSGLMNIPSGGQTNPDRSILDFLKSDISGLRSNNRLSAEDKLKLEGHLYFVSELEKKVNGFIVTNECVLPSQQRYTSNSFTVEQMNELYVELIALGFSCGLNKVATFIPLPGNALAWNGADPHQTVAHGRHVEKALEPEKYKLKIMAQLANRLRDIPESSSNMLDSTVLVSLREHQVVSRYWSGEMVHCNCDLQAVILGGKKLFNSGYVYDFRDSTRMRNGLGGKITSYNEFAHTIMLGMGLEAKDWETGGSAGFGYFPRESTRIRKLEYHYPTGQGNEKDLYNTGISETWRDLRDKRQPLPHVSKLVRS